MSTNILITGAAGYIGGSIVGDFLAKDSPLIRKENLIAAVRSEEQAKAMSGLGVKVIQLDLSDEKAVTEAVLGNKINIVIQTASSLDPALSLPLVTALGEQKKRSGKATYYIHTSGLSAFCESTGWPKGVTKDTDPVFDIEKKLADSFPLRKTDVAVTEHSKELGVTSFIVVPSLVYGRGSGPYNQLSILIPLYVQGCISQKKVYKFAENRRVSGVHVKDVTALFWRIIERILLDDPPASGTEGYYFALAHEVVWWEVLEHLAKALKARGLAEDTQIEVWPNDETAAKALGVPIPFVNVLWDSSDNIETDNERRLGWKPVWTKERFLENIDDEVKDVLELGKAKSSLVGSLFAAASG